MMLQGYVYLIILVSHVIQVIVFRSFSIGFLSHSLLKVVCFSFLFYLMFLFFLGVLAVVAGVQLGI